MTGPVLGNLGWFRKPGFPKFILMLSARSHLPSASEAVRCIRKHITQPRRLGEKAAKPVSNWINKRYLGRKNGIAQFGSNPGLNALKPSGWNVPQPLNDLVQKRKRYVSTKTWTVGHFPSVSAAEITRRDMLIAKILLWQCQRVLTLISSQPAFA